MGSLRKVRVLRSRYWGVTLLSTSWEISLYSLGSQAVVVVNHASLLYYKYMSVEFQSSSTWVKEFLPGIPVSSVLKTDWFQYLRQRLHENRGEGHKFIPRVAYCDVSPPWNKVSFSRRKMRFRDHFSTFPSSLTSKTYTINPVGAASRKIGISFRQVLTLFTQLPYRSFHFVYWTRKAAKFTTIKKARAEPAKRPFSLINMQISDVLVEKSSSWLLKFPVLYNPCL